MLGKLIKYEFMATGKNFLPLYGAIIVLSIINRIFVFSDLDYLNSSDIGFFGGATHFFKFTMNMLFFAIMIAIGVITLLVVIQRFYKNLYGDQGYLMHTLPIHKWKLIASKVTVSAVWAIASGIVIITSIFILFVNTSFIFEFFRFLGQIIDELGFSLILEGIVLSIVGCMSTILGIYAAISVGHMFNSFKVLWSFGAYILFSLIESNIVFIGINILEGVLNIFDSLVYGDISYLMYESPQIFLGLLIAYELIMATVYFVITHIIMDKKLNLQ